MAAPSKKRERRRRRTTGAAPMVFTRRNYTLMLIGVVLITAGYTLMRIENAYQGTLSLYVAPLLILGGYGLIGYAILARPSASEAAPE